MRFFIGAFVTTLIMSPVSVLSMAIGTESTALESKSSESFTKRQVDNFGQSVVSSSFLEKRFCLKPGGCNKKYLKRSSGFQCKKKYISPEKIERAKAAGCPKIREDNQRSTFPSLYTASDFAVPGPYLEWPISRNGRFWNKLRKGKYRIIMTKSCKVVGVVIREKKSSYRTCKDLSREENEDEESDD
ncbi:hypothetical protein HI914_05406 [Erysiphe necator]|nr:hypothetical protein HI914_05406 [Erysiphe necator]